MCSLHSRDSFLHLVKKFVSTVTIVAPYMMITIPHKIAMPFNDIHWVVSCFKLEYKNQKDFAAAKMINSHRKALIGIIDANTAGMKGAVAYPWMDNSLE